MYHSFLIHSSANPKRKKNKIKDDCSLEVKLYQPRQHTKRRDISLPTNVHLVKAMDFPVVMYGCESWTIKKAEHQIIDCF